MRYKLYKQYRHKHYNYSNNGYYFVTICIKNKELFFGEIIRRNRAVPCSSPYIKLSEIGQIAKKYWLEIPNHFPFVKIDNFIVMPNHMHGIIVIDNKNIINNVGTGHCPALFMNAKISQNVAKPKWII